MLRASVRFSANSAPLCEAFSAFCLTFVLGALSQAENWDRFRGPNGEGQSDAVSIPVEWTEANLLWKRPLVGMGHSSPVVWGDRIFVTSADRQSAEQVVAAFDAPTGRPLWTKRLPGATYPIHAQSSFASSTPALDAERLYYLWRVGDVAWIVAFTHAGDEVWRREISRATDVNGFGVSPVVVDGIVVTAVENEKDDSFLTGFDAATGDIRWRVPRTSGSPPYCTPFTIHTRDGKKLLVTASTAAGLCAFDPANGHLVWQAIEKEIPQRIVGSPIEANGIIVISCGQNGNGHVTIAVKRGEGNEPPKEVYRTRENVPYVPTPVVAGDLLFLWGDRGIVSCLELTTGRQVWRERVGGNFNCSPIRVGDRIYCASMDGEVVVIAADRTFKVLARNELGGPTNATPAVAGGRMYFRTESTLMCIGERAAAN
jgi:outer membrane protein assembly factor BamB